MTVCVVGGAGYIGSQTVWALRDAGRSVVVYDDFSTGRRSLLPPDIPIAVGDVRNEALATSFFQTHKVRALIHCAGLSEVSASVQEPQRYWDVNVLGTEAICRAAHSCGVQSIVFSSSASVYGEPGEVPVQESQPLQPINPYGHTKVAAERALAQCEALGGPSWLAFRYFNAAGADRARRCGEWHEPETHLIPRVLEVARAFGAQEPVQPLSVYGTNYPTRDGTCVRDYVHTLDLARAHLLGLAFLEQGGTSRALNVGSGRGYSVLELVETAPRVSEIALPWVDAPLRAGDPAVLIADIAQAQAILGWKPAHSSLDEICQTAWDWHEHLHANKTATNA